MAIKFVILTNEVDDFFCLSSKKQSEPGANPTIVSYNDRGVQIFNAKNSIVRF
jgi:hypothetical protein